MMINRHLLESMNDQMAPDCALTNAVLKKIKESPQKNFSAKPLWIAGAAAAVCIAVAIPAALLFPKTAGKQDAALKSSVPEPAWGTVEDAQNESVDADLSQVIAWESRPIHEQYTNMEIDGAAFYAIGKIVVKEQVGELLCQTVITGIDDFDTDYLRQHGEFKEHQITAEVYQLKSISKKCLLAVKYPGHGEYYAYKTIYTPDTFGQLCDDLNLEELLAVDGIFYENKNTMVTLPNQRETIWRFLREYRAAGYADPIASKLSGGELGIKVSIPSLKQAETSAQIADMELYISISKSGWLITNVYGSLQAFDIGADKANALIDYVLKNGQKTNT